MSSEQSRNANLSGCLVWFLLFGVLFSCLCSVATFAGAFAATFGAETVAAIVDDYICPEGSTGEIITYDVIPRRNTTDYEMQCVMAGGVVIRDPSPDYAFYWLGALAVACVVIAGLLALIIAIPFRTFIGRRASRSQ